MKRTWLVWTLVGGVLITVLIAFNYERGKEAVPLSEIFPEKGAMNTEVEYEFFDTDEKGSALIAQPQVKETIRPAQTAPVTVAKAPAPPAPVKQSVAAVNTSVKSKPAAASTLASSGSVTATAAGARGNGKVYTIQVAAFKERSRADKAVTQAQQKGYSAYVDERSRSDGSIWYQVCIGKFDALSPAKELLLKIKQDYKDGYIRNLSGK